MSVAKPLTAEMIRAKAKAQAGGVANYELFFKALAKNFSNELQGFNVSPVKVSVAGASVVSLPVAKQSGNLFRFMSGRRLLRIWTDADRAFDYLLAELCLGGSGTPNGESEEVRPLSKFERSLRNTVLKTLVFTIPPAAEIAHNTQLIEAEPESEDEKLKEPRVETCVALRLLVNVFTLAGEITILFHSEELSRSLNIVPLDEEFDETLARKTLENTPFELTVFLKPQMFPLANVLSMAPGQVFPLSISMASPVSVFFEGQHISEGRLDVTPDGIGISVEATDPSKSIPPSPFTSVG
jgi:flagellar motor switch/type III secretory pathway protein FliN